MRAAIPERVIFHVDMNAFFAAVEQRFNPTLRGKPIIICGKPNTRSVVAACSYEAKAFGIKNGMSTLEARQLCAHVIPVAGNPEKYVDVSQRIFEIYRSFTPQMEVFSIDEAFLEMTATYRRVGNEPQAAARAIKRRIRDAYGLTCSVGIGPNKLIAKVASNLQKPDGLVWVRADEVPALMARLPIEALCGIGAKLKGYLNDYGIITCADLGRAPAAVLNRRFGMVGRALTRMGQGIDESPVVPSSASASRKSMGHCYTLPRDTADERVIFGTLLRLCEQLARRLRVDGSQSRTVSLTIRYADFSGCHHARTMAQPTDSGVCLYEVARGLYREWCDPLSQRVRLVGIGASQLIRRQRQMSFLHDEVQRERIDRCLDRLADRFGEFTVVRASAAHPLVPRSHGFLHHTAS